MTSSLTQQYVQGYHGLLKTTLPTAVYYYQDELGSTSHIADASGAVLEYYKYDLYGAPTYWNAGGTQITASAKNVQVLGNGGSRWMPELGLYDNRNRFMSPDLGRFLQPDPIGFKGDASNLYRYVGNDWANRTDPMGLLGDTSLQREENAANQAMDGPEDSDQQDQKASDAKQAESKDNRSFDERLSAWEKEHQVSVYAHPGVVESRRDLEAREIRDAVVDGLNRLGDCKGDCNSNIRQGDDQFARVVDRDKIDTSKWREEYSSHPSGKTALESGAIPGHPSFDMKLYQKDQAHNNQIAVVHPTGTWTHRAEFVGYLLGMHINARNAESYIREQPVE